MQSYLFISKNKKLLDKEVKKRANDLKARIIPLEVQKIADVREVSSLTSLKVTGVTIFTINYFNLVTEEAQNALLKAIEEPQDNLYYFLTAESKENILPTIISRCRLIEFEDQADLSKEIDKIEEFLNYSFGNKLQFTSKIADREKAIKFLKNLTNYLDNLLLAEKNERTLKYLKTASITKKSIESNGNIQLHLTNLVIKLHK